MKKETEFFGIFTLHTLIGTMLGGLFGIVLFVFVGLIIHLISYDVNIKQYEQFKSLFILIGLVIGYIIGEKVNKNYIQKQDEILGYNMKDQQLRFFNAFSVYSLIGITIGAFCGLLFSLVVYTFVIVTIYIINNVNVSMPKYFVIVELIGTILGAIIGYIKGERISRKKLNKDN